MGSKICKVRVGWVCRARTTETRVQVESVVAASAGVRPRSECEAVRVRARFGRVGSEGRTVGAEVDRDRKRSTGLTRVTQTRSEARQRARVSCFLCKNITAYIRCGTCPCVGECTYEVPKGLMIEAALGPMTCESRAIISDVARSCAIASDPVRLSCGDV